MASQNAHGGMQARLLAWYDAEKRDLPWRHTKDPYAIWVSEIMLQQTRAETVTGYWTRFMARYPTVHALAGANEQEVLKAWEGLGYYSRARNLLRCAKAVVECHQGVFPRDVKALMGLPGIGAYTAGAVASIAFDIPVSAVDGNVERVVARYCGIREDVGVPSVKRKLRALADGLVPQVRPGDFNQAMMELGARVCQPAPRCDVCPVSLACDAYRAGDARDLPIKQKKAPQKVLPRGIALVFHGGRVLVYQREERLLQGLWCFPGLDHPAGPEDVRGRLHALGVEVRFVAALGNARHVFTHLIWEMELMRFEADTMAYPDTWTWRWVNRQELLGLPMPTAMKAALEKVMEILGTQD